MCLRFLNNSILYLYMRRLRKQLETSILLFMIKFIFAKSMCTIEQLNFFILYTSYLLMSYSFNIWIIDCETYISFKYYRYKCNIALKILSNISRFKKFLKNKKEKNRKNIESCII